MILKLTLKISFEYYNNNFEKNAEIECQLYWFWFLLDCDFWWLLALLLFSYAFFFSWFQMIIPSICNCIWRSTHFFSNCRPSHCFHKLNYRSIFFFSISSWSWKVCWILPTPPAFVTKPKTIWSSLSVNRRLVRPGSSVICQWE